MAKAK